MVTDLQSLSSWTIKSLKVVYLLLFCVEELPVYWSFYNEHHNHICGKSICFTWSIKGIKCILETVLHFLIKFLISTIQEKEFQTQVGYWFGWRGKQEGRWERSFCFSPVCAWEGAPLFAVCLHQCHGLEMIFQYHPQNSLGRGDREVARERQGGRMSEGVNLYQRCENSKACWVSMCFPVCP